MVVFIASVAVGLILIVALLAYNMQAFTSTPQRRSERQYPLDPSPAEEPDDARGTEAKAEGAGLSHARRAGEREPSAAAEAAGGAETIAAPGAVEALRAVEATQETGAIEGAERAEAEEVPAAGSSDGRASADIEYREAIRRLQLQQPEEAPEPTAKEAAADAPMSDDDYRSALRRFGSRGKRS